MRGKILKAAFNFLALSLAVSFLSCGSSSSPLPSGIGNVTAPEEAQAAAVSKARDIAVGSHSIFLKLVNVGLESIGLPVSSSKRFAAGLLQEETPEVSKLLMRLAGPGGGSAISTLATTTQGPVACSGGGTYSYVFDGAAGTYTFTFNDCRENDLQMSGPYVLKSTESGYTVVMGNAGSTFKILDFDKEILVASLEAAVSIDLTKTGGSTAGNYSMVANGNMKLRDFLSISGEYTLVFTQFSDDYSFGPGASSISIGGKYNETWRENKFLASFEGLSVDITDTASGSDASVNGSVVFDFTPNIFCLDGRYNISTEVPVRFDSAAGHNVRGRQLINGSTVMEWQTNGKIKVTLGSGAVLMYDNESAMTQQCPFATPDAEAPKLSGLTGSATGDNMTITSLWVGGTTSDMDLHLNYYDTTSPNAATPLTWYVDWHKGKNCTDSSGQYSDAIDVNGDGACDIGLDIDDVEGYGPEHITATTLPAGYYVISVNSFSLDQDPYAIVSATIKIGNTTFGVYQSGKLTVGDGDGSNPAAWMRVADIRVNGDGTVDVLTPNGALQPWHSDSSTLRTHAGKPLRRAAE